MKKYYFLIVGFLFFGIVNAQIANIPDTNFKNALIVQGYDTNNNEEIELSEVQVIESLDVSGYEINDLSGIQLFTNLQSLICKGNFFSSLNLSGLSNLTYVDCSYSYLYSINLTGVTNLEEIDISANYFSSLDITDNINLKKIFCQVSGLSSIDVSNNELLTELNCSYTQLTNLDISNNTLLTKLYCEYCPLSNLDISNNTLLTAISCEYNQLTSLDISNNPLLTELNCSSMQLTNLDISNNTLLTKLNCAANLLTNLDISNNPLLTGLICSSNPLISLDISNNPLLTKLYCENNSLISLDISNNPLLTELSCVFNQLSSLDVNNNPLLIYLECSGNQLTNLNLSYNSALNELYCSSNLFTTIDLSNNNFLNIFMCSDSQLTNIDLSNKSELNAIYCENNNLLTSLNIKNSSFENQIFIAYNPNLQYICADDNQIEEIQSLITQFNYINCSVNSYCSFLPGGISYTIQGNVKYDNEFDGCDDLDVVFPNIKFLISDGINSGYAIADSSGNYELPVLPGTHIITPILENIESFIITPQTIEVTFPDATSPVIQNFCITAVPVNDLEITLLPLNNARPGFNSDYKIVYKNKGNQTQSGNINFSFSDNVADYVTANPLNTGQVINSLSWSFTNLQPFETREILVTLNLNSPLETPPLIGGAILNYTATITGASDETPLDNVAILNQTVVNSFDPNDKTCLEGATITPSQVGKEVHYMIRFENTGTANAENIVVKDMIDTTKFEINSLIPISGSHPFVTRITNTNKVEFIFENIQLPFDDANNDGYVAFKIKTKPSLVLGNTFSNTASIYFDYNFPIVTNTATTTVSNVLANQDFKFDNYISISPNPAKETLIINTRNIEVSSISIYNTLGQLVQVIPNAKETITIDVSQLKSGSYFIKVISDKGTSSSKFIKE